MVRLPLLGAVSLGLAVGGSIWLTERAHVAQLKREAQAALEYSLADAALDGADVRTVARSLRSVPGVAVHHLDLSLSEPVAKATADVTLPSAWGTLRPEGHRIVLSASVRVEKMGRPSAG